MKLSMICWRHDKTSHTTSIQGSHVEQWLFENDLDAEQRARPGMKCRIYDYFDKDEAKLAERPWVGVRVSEVDCSDGQ